jgi:uncharacterized protein YecT (DUF1311 family)
MNDRRRAPLPAAFALLALALPAAAETYPVGPLRVEIPALTDPTACMDRADGSDRALAACSGPEIAAWDRRLNAAFAALRRDRVAWISARAQ